MTKERCALVIGVRSWSTIAASVAPRDLVIPQTASARVISFFSPAPPGVTKHTTSKSEVTDQAIWSTSEAQSPAHGVGYWACGCCLESEGVCMCLLNSFERIELMLVLLELPRNCQC